jgi:hypothetical protein
MAVITSVITNTKILKSGLFSYVYSETWILCSGIYVFLDSMHICISTTKTSIGTML